MSRRTAVFFAGAAGSSLGARAAECDVIWAANHEQACIDAHAANFPSAQHVREDLVIYDHGRMPEHDILLASPVCRGHSQAGQPGRAADPKIASRHNRYRATAWSVIDAAEIHMPPVIVCENVEDWRSWRLYRGWRSCIEDLGYTVSEAVLDAAAWGVPQRRRRLFVVALRSGRWIEPALRDPYVVPVGMHDAIDWDAGEWLDFGACKGGKARAQLERAHAEFSGGPAWVQQVSHRPVRSSSEPISTLTTADQVRVVYRGKYRSPTAREAFSLMGFPPDYVMPKVGRSVASAMAGDAVCPPVMQAVLERALG